VRDLVWTLIVIWVIWKIYSMFNIYKLKQQPINQKDNYQKKPGEVKIDKNVTQKTYYNANDGEYVDYEEIK
jgi:hypothetical protein